MDNRFEGLMASGKQPSLPIAGHSARLAYRPDLDDPLGPAGTEKNKQNRFLTLPREIRLIICDHLFEGFTLCRQSQTSQKHRLHTNIPSALITTDARPKCVYTPPTVLSNYNFSGQVLKDAISQPETRPGGLPSDQPPNRSPNMICRVCTQLRQEAVPILAKSTNVLICPTLPSTSRRPLDLGNFARDIRSREVQLVHAGDFLNDRFRFAIKGLCLSLRSTLVVEHASLPNVERISIDGFIDGDSALNWDESSDDEDASEVGTDMEDDTDNASDECEMDFDDANRVTSPISLSTWTPSDAQSWASHQETALDPPSATTASPASPSNIAYQLAMANQPDHKYVSEEDPTANPCNTLAQKSQANSSDTLSSPISSPPCSPQHILLTDYLPVSPRRLHNRYLIRHYRHLLSTTRRTVRQRTALEKTLVSSTLTCFSLPEMARRSGRAVYPEWARRWWFECVWLAKHRADILRKPREGRMLLERTLRSLRLDYKIEDGLGVRRVLGDVLEALSESEVNDHLWLDWMLGVIAEGGKSTAHDIAKREKMKVVQWADGVGKRAPGPAMGKGRTVIGPQGLMKRVRGENFPDFAIQQAFQLDGQEGNESYLVRFPSSSFPV